MKIRLFLLGCVLIFAASCNNNKKEVEALKAAHDKDSVALVNSKSKDSIISAYVNAMGEIQDNLDSLKTKEHILTMAAGEGKTGQKEAIKESIKSIDSAIILSNRKIFQLESQIKHMQNHDAGLKKMIARLTDEITQKNQEIALLQSKLSANSDSMTMLTHRFNDSIGMINKQRRQLNEMTTEMNTAFYIVGTLKQLKEKGAIDTKGGILGIARTAELKAGANTANFTKVDVTQLTTIPLNGRFSKILTSHPAGSYSVTHNKKKEPDVLTIKDQGTFWSQSKYLIIEIK